MYFPYLRHSVRIKIGQLVIIALEGSCGGAKISVVIVCVPCLFVYYIIFGYVIQGI